MYEPYFYICYCSVVKNLKMYPLVANCGQGLKKKYRWGCPTMEGPDCPLMDTNCTGSLVERDITGGCDLVTLCLWKPQLAHTIVSSLPYSYVYGNFTVTVLKIIIEKPYRWSWLQVEVHWLLEGEPEVVLDNIRWARCLQQVSLLGVSTCGP